jgi:hypothetical protein
MYISIELAADVDERLGEPGAGVSERLRAAAAQVRVSSGPHA